MEDFALRAAILHMSRLSVNFSFFTYETKMTARRSCQKIGDCKQSTRFSVGNFYNRQFITANSPLLHLQI